MPFVCQISLNKENAPFIAGKDNVVARVTLSNYTTRLIDVLIIRFYGRTQVQFRSARHNRNEAETETIIDSAYEVRGKGVLAVGSYTFQESFPIPDTCLTSLESQFGQIRYEISLEILNQDRFDKIFTRPISVVKTYDLNAFPRFKNPQYRFLNTSKWLCLPSGSTFRVTTPFRAYAPGQIIHYNLEALNKASERVEFYAIRLLKIMKFRTSEVSLKKQKQSPLFSVHTNDNGENDQTIEDTIIVPSTTPTTKFFMIKVKYILVVTASLQKSRRELRLELPIDIGTVPLLESYPSNPETETPKRINPISFQADNSGEPMFVGEANLPMNIMNRRRSFKPLYPSY